MSRPFSIVYSANQSDYRTIRSNGFISCLVHYHVPRSVSKRMGFCLHCRELLSYNGALKHCKQLAERHEVGFQNCFVLKNWTCTNNKLCQTRKFGGKSGVQRKETVPKTRTLDHVNVVLLKLPRKWKPGSSMT